MTVNVRISKPMSNVKISKMPMSNVKICSIRALLVGSESDLNCLISLFVIFLYVNYLHMVCHHASIYLHHHLSMLTVYSPIRVHTDITVCVINLFGS